MRDNDEIQMTRLWQPPARQANAELMTNPEGCGVIFLERRDAGCAKVERGVLNALEKIAVLPPGIRALSGQTAIVFRHSESSIGEADQPWVRLPYRRTRAEATTFVRHCFSLRHLVIPSSFFRRMFVSRHDIGTQKKIVDVSHSE
jgi:hypothetical protein